MYKLILVFLIIISSYTNAEAYLGPGAGGGIILAIFWNYYCSFCCNYWFDLVSFKKIV